MQPSRARNKIMGVFVPRPVDRCHRPSSAVLATPSGPRLSTVKPSNDGPPEPVKSARNRFVP